MPRTWPRTCIARCGPGIICVLVTVVVSLLTRPKPEAELKGLVYGATEIPPESYVTVLHRPWFWATVVGVVFIALQIAYW